MICKSTHHLFAVSRTPMKKTTSNISSPSCRDHQFSAKATRLCHMVCSSKQNYFIFYLHKWLFQCNRNFNRKSFNSTVLSSQFGMSDCSTEIVFKEEMDNKRPVNLSSYDTDYPTRVSASAPSPAQSTKEHHTE